MNLKLFFYVLCLGLIIPACQSGTKPEILGETVEKRGSDLIDTARQSDTVVNISEAKQPAIRVKEEKPKNIRTKSPDPSDNKKGDRPEKVILDVSDISEGQDLIAASGCLVCHKLDGKSVGPSYSEVAKKYTHDPGTIENLVGKIIAGGMGNWGQIPMPSHPNISHNEAKKMVGYILSLK